MMMTFIRLLALENGFVTYEYGRNKQEMIGTVTVEITNKDNCTFDFYEESKIKKVQHIYRSYHCGHLSLYQER